MNKPESILTDTEMHALICGNPSTLGLSIAYLKDFIRQVEQAVIDKLAEQEPVVYRFLPPDTQQYMYITDDVPKIKEFEPLYAHPMPSKPYSIDKDDAGIRKLVSEAITGAIHGGLEGGEAPPVGHWLNEFYEYGAAYENMQSRVHKNEVACMSQPTDKKACVSENAEIDTQRHLSYLKRYQKWRRGEDKTMDEAGLTPKQIGEALDWLIGVADDHIADASKMVCSDHIAGVRNMAECAKCGHPAIHYLVMDNLGYPNKTPFCGDCTQEHEQLAQDTNEHEIRNFGGAYGLVSYHYEPLGTAQPDHIADMRKKAPDGWQLTPTQATNDMYMGFCNVRSDIEPDEFREAYRAMLEAAPKYTGEK